MNGTTACTIVSKNYLAYARTLMETVGRHHPDWHRVVLLVDRVDGALQRDEEAFGPFEGVERVELATLPLPHLQRLAFRYNQLELNTAVKPWLLDWLLERGADRVVYLDPDVDLHAPLEAVDSALGAGASIVLTPHLTAPLDSRGRPDDRDILQAGTYNLGFLALRRGPAAKALLRWWQERNEFDCVVLPHEGLFVDQRWMDLAPGLFPEVSILRDPGYNVAYWNFSHRIVSRSGDGLRANGEPLAFLHWSGLDPTHPEGLSVHQTRHRLHELGVVADLAHDYLDRLRANGHDTFRQLPYAYGSFRDGTPILDAVRHHYRRDDKVQRRGGEDPFALSHSVFNEPGWWQPPGTPLVTRAMRGLWEMTPHLQARFPQPGGAHRRAFATFFAALHAPEFRIPYAYVAPVLASLEGVSRLVGDPVVASRVTGPVLRQIRHVSRRLSPETKVRARDLFRRALGRVGETAPGTGPPGASEAGPASPTPSLMLAGHFHHPTGVGALADATRAAAVAARLPFEVVDCGIPLDAETARHLAPHPIQLLHANADELPTVVDRLRLERLTDRYRIGVWAWELPEFPDAWLESFELLDEVWAISGFVQRALAEKSPIPVVAMPPAVAVSRPASARRSDFGLPEDHFLFLATCDADSITRRKNPEGAVRAFRRAFPEPRRTSLVLKLHSARGDDLDPALRALGDEPGVMLLDGTRSRAEVTALESLCDASVSLHRSEGFGLVPAECMALGKPAIATGWSGNLEYMTRETACLVDFELVELDRDEPPYRKGQRWAEPDLDHAAHHMRQLREDDALRRRLARSGRDRVRALLHPDVVGGRMRRRLEGILERRRGGRGR